nr:succinylglutamate desuccinylase/aspartoacylase family protein [Azospirillum oleiclasticum]
MNEQAPPVQLVPPDIAPYRCGNTGVDYVTTLVSGQPGPHVVLNALMHGNELCGAIALDALLRMGVRPRRGSLTFAFANVAAYRAFDAERPYVSRYIDEDMNRLWATEVLESRRSSVELRRARALLPIFGMADVLLDLHSMTNDSAPLTLCGRTERAAALAHRLGHPGWIVADAGHAAGLRLIDHPRFAAGGAGTALLVECGQHWQAATAAVALEVCLRLLTVLEVIDPAVAAAGRIPVRDGPPRQVEVTHAVTATTDEFTFTETYTGLEVIPRAGTVIARDGATLVTTPYDGCVLIMPGRRLRPGQTAVRLGRIVG